MEKLKFKYDFKTIHNMWIVDDNKLIKQNAKRNNLSLDFSDTNTLYAKRDLFVFITHKAKDGLFQVIVNNNTDFNNSPIKELTDIAQNFVGKMTIQDLSNFNNN